jgi:hypothetical protein
MRRALWQGRADSLCGIYCLLFAIRNLEVFGTDPDKRDRRALYELLKSAEKLGYLTAGYLAGVDAGYPSNELIQIFNGLAPRFRGGLKAFPLLEKSPDYDRNVKYLRDILGNGGFALIDVKKSSHWVCAIEIESSGRALCFDPSAKRQSVSVVRASTVDGVAILPNRGSLR